MKRIKIILYLVALALISVNSAKALTTVDFEDIPTTYHHSVGDQNLGGYYTGLNFGPDATILDKATGEYNDLSYPPHSGDAVLFSYSIPYIKVDFVGVTANYVETWYTTTTSNFYLEAYDSSDALLVSSTGSYNIRTNSLISVSADNIAYVKLHNSGNLFTIDDFGYETGAIVIPAPGAILLCSIGVGIVGWLRRRRVL